MRPALFLASLAISLAATAAAHATVAVHGLNHEPLGAAVLSVATDPVGNKQLNITDIGSSGQDGVAIGVPRFNGLWMVYGTPPPPGPGQSSKPIVHRDLAARLAQPLLAGVVYHAIEDLGLSGTGIDLSFDFPGEPDAVIELFNGNQMVYSARTGYAMYHARGSLHLDGPSVSIGEPGVAVAFRFGRPAVNTALTGCSFEMQRPSACEVTIEGVAHTADRIKVRFPWLDHGDEDSRCTQVTVLASCADDGSPGSGDMAITFKGAPATPIKKKSNAQGLTISAISGITLADGGGTGNDQRIRLVADDGPTAEPATVSVWQLPPGTPVVHKTAEDLAVRIIQSGSSQAPGQTVTYSLLPVSGVAGIAGGVVAGIVVAAVIVACVSQGPNVAIYAPAPDPSALTQSIALYKHVPGQPEPQLVVANNGGNGVEVRAPKTRHHRARAESGVITMGFGFDSGSTVSIDGVPYDADSLVFVTTRPTENIIGFAGEDLHLSPGVQLTLGSAECVPFGKGRGVAGKAMILTGSASFAYDESDPGVIRNLGAAGNDGVSYLTDGVPSIRLPFAGGLTLDPGAGLKIDADPCDDGECTPITTLEMRRSPAGQPEVVSLNPKSPTHSNPYFNDNVNAGDIIQSAFDLDSDGDGLAELYALPGSTVSFSSIAYRQLSPYRECFQLTFHSPVQIIRNGVPVTITSLEIGYNISGQPLGGASPKPRAISLAQLPPGTPYFRSISGLGPEAVTVSGTGSDAALTSNSIAGYPVLPTWATMSGPGRLIDPDGDGPAGMELLRVAARDAYGNPTQDEVRLKSEHDLEPYGENDGYVFKGDLDLIPSSGDGVVVAIVVAVDVAGVGQKTASLDVTGSPGGLPVPKRLAYSHLEIAPQVECAAYMNGVLQSSFPYTGELECSELPIIMAMRRPVPGGALQAECRFRSSAVISSGAIIVVCDELRFMPVGGDPISQVDGAELKLNGLPPGVPWTEWSMARIVPESVILAAPGDGVGAAPAAFALSRAYPNPMRATSAVRFALPAKQQVRAVVMDVAGRQVARLAEQEFEAGEHTLRWNGMGEGGAPVPAGLYFVRVESAGKSKTTRVSLLQ